MRGEDHKKLLQEFTSGETRALSRLISLAENRDLSLLPLLKEIYSRTGKAHIVGLTGGPGAGKSSLINSFIRFLRAQKKTVAVISVDPVSPFSGGALLGDRIRLVDHFNDPGVYIRSLSTRGRLGGLSLATREVVHLADAFGFDYLLVETVGVGQSEVDVRKIADITLVVLVPEWGDGIQAIKAGILEIGDIFTVNKSDREGAERVVAEIKNMLQMAGRVDAPVVMTSIQQEGTVRELFTVIVDLIEKKNEAISRRRETQNRETVEELLEAIVIAQARQWVEKNLRTSKNPYAFIETFLKTEPLKKWFTT